MSCLTIFSTSLSVAAFLRRAGVSMSESTGSHSLRRRGVELEGRGGYQDETHSRVELHVDLTCVSGSGINVKQQPVKKLNILASS